MKNKINEKNFYSLFLVLSCFLIGFAVGYGVAFNHYAGDFFDSFSKINQMSNNTVKQNFPDKNQKSSPSVISETDKKLIDNWIKKNNLNDYGDPQDTIYAGGTPLFDQASGKMIDKYEYIVERHPTKPWLQIAY